MSRYAMCPVCGRRMRRDKDIFGNWDGETYICDHCAGNDDGNEMSVFEAAEVWASNGKDEDYMFGFSEEELEDAFDD